MNRMKSCSSCPNSLAPTACLQLPKPAGLTSFGACSKSVKRLTGQAIRGTAFRYCTTPDDGEFLLPGRCCPLGRLIRSPSVWCESPAGIAQPRHRQQQAYPDCRASFAAPSYTIASRIAVQVARCTGDRRLWWRETKRDCWPHRPIRDSTSVHVHPLQLLASPFAGRRRYCPIANEPLGGAGVARCEVRAVPHRLIVPTCVCARPNFVEQLGIVGIEFEKLLEMSSGLVAFAESEQDCPQLHVNLSITRV